MLLLQGGSSGGAPPAGRSGGVSYSSCGAATPLGALLLQAPPATGWISGGG